MKLKTHDLINEYLISLQGLSKSAKRWYKCLLTHFEKSCTELPRQPGPIEEFLGGYEDENRFAHYRAIRAFYNVILQRHLAEIFPKSKKLLGMGLPVEKVKQIFNPMNPENIPARIPKKKIPYSLNEIELAWLLAVPLNPRDRALICLIIDTGVRISEVLNLCFSDIQNEYITVEGKTGQREIPISAEVRDQLRILGRQGKIFKSSRGTLTTDGAYPIVKSALQRAGIQAKKWGPHTLRHTFGRQYIKAGGDLVSLQRLMGHAKIATTRIYAELDLRDITDQHTKFTPYLAARKSAQGLLWMKNAIPQFMILLIFLNIFLDFMGLDIAPETVIAL